MFSNKFNFLFFMAVATAVSAQNLHNPESNPKLIMYSGDETAGVNNWVQANQFCRKKGRILATQAEWCSGKGGHRGTADDVYDGIKKGVHWAPVRGKVNNMWVQVGHLDGKEDAACKAFNQIYPDTNSKQKVTDKRNTWVLPEWGLDDTQLEFENKYILCSSVPKAPKLPKTCARVWGDPHVVTYDGLKYDAQGDGDYILQQSLDSPLNIQGRFFKVKKRGVSVMRGFTIDTGRDDEPTMEIHFNPNSPEGKCWMQHYVDGAQTNLNKNYVLHGTYAAKSTGVHFIKKKKNRFFVFPTSGISVEYKPKLSKRNGCVFALKVCVPDDIKANEKFIGLMGSPDGDKSNDWMDKSGVDLKHGGNTKWKPAYEYTNNNYCIQDMSENTFKIAREYKCDATYNDTSEKAVQNPSPEVAKICGGDEDCLLEAVDDGDGADAETDIEEAIAAIEVERELEEEKDVDVDEDDELEAAEEDEFQEGVDPVEDFETVTEDGETVTEDGETVVDEEPASKSMLAPPKEEDDKTLRSGGGFGDPHFKKWDGETYDFHGECDMWLITDQNFLNGLDLEVQVRTKIYTWWSGISAAAIRVGKDVFEVQGGKDGEVKYWINGVEGELVGEGESLPQTIAGHQVKLHHPDPHKTRFRIDFGEFHRGNSISIEAVNELVRVNVRATGKGFNGAQGLMGSYPTGQMLGRDGETVIEDTTAFGNEWQVRASEESLFREAGAVQHPNKCVMPDTSSQKKRRLGAGAINRDQANAACAGVGEDRAACVADVLATQSKDAVKLYN